MHSQDKLNGFECVCEIGYTGLACDQNVDDCVPVSCQDGGTCIVSDNPMAA